jgi:hypothetical protein
MSDVDISSTRIPSSLQHATERWCQNPRRLSSKSSPAEISRSSRFANCRGRRISKSFRSSIGLPHRDRTMDEALFSLAGGEPMTITDLPQAVRGFPRAKTSRHGAGPISRPRLLPASKSGLQVTAVQSPLNNYQDAVATVNRALDL